MKCQKSPSILLLQTILSKVKGQKFRFFPFFSETVSFIVKIGQTKIVDHTILYKNCFNTFLRTNHHSWDIAILRVEKVIFFKICTHFRTTYEVRYLAHFFNVASPVGILHPIHWKNRTIANVQSGTGWFLLSFIIYFNNYFFIFTFFFFSLQNFCTPF